MGIGWSESVGKPIVVTGALVIETPLSLSLWLLLYW